MEYGDADVDITSLYFPDAITTLKETNRTIELKIKYDKEYDAISNVAEYLVNDKIMYVSLDNNQFDGISFTINNYMNTH